MFYYKYRYFPAPLPVLFQGTRAELHEKLKSTGLRVLSGSCGTYKLGGSSSGKIYEYPDVTSHNPIRVITPDKEMLRERYNKLKITEKDYARLTTELNNGDIMFDSLVGIDK